MLNGKDREPEEAPSEEPLVPDDAAPGSQLHQLEIRLQQALAERRQAEADLRAATEASAHLVAIVTQSEDAIVSKDLTGRIKSWNAAAERIFGYSAAEAIGRSIHLIIPNDRQSEEAVVLERIGRGEQ